jgi:hypothetical protein
MASTLADKAWFVKVTIPGVGGASPEEQTWIAPFDTGGEAAGAVDGAIRMQNPNASVSVERELTPAEIKSHDVKPSMIKRQ